MTDGNHIIDTPKMKSNPFSAPEGYFDSLKASLENISSPNDHETNIFQKLSPYLYIAAAMASIFIVVAMLIRIPYTNYDNDDEILLNYSYIMPSVDKDYIYEADSDEQNREQITSEEIQEYIINYNISVEELNYFASYEQ